MQNGRTYFFRPEKKILKQGFLMTDEEKNIVYEAKPVKQSLLGPATFEFVNHIADTKETHKIGKTVTSEQSGLLEFFSTKSYFKLDGKNIWDVLHEEDIRIDSRFSGSQIGTVYTVFLKGEEIATIASAAADEGKFVVTSPFHYNVTVSEEYLAIAFLVAFSIARTDQIFYD